MRIERSQYQPQFTGVIPVKVRVDDTLVTSQDLVTSACRKAVTALTSPTQKGTKEYNAMVKYLEKDNDYNPRRILLTRKQMPSMTSSDFMRVIQKDSRSYLLTGKEADQIRIAGKNIGKIQGMLKRMGYLDSLGLQQAKNAYKNAIDSILSRKTLRITEGYDPITKAKTGEQVQLVLNMKSNKKYGKRDFKFNFDSIDFEPVKV